MKCIAFINGTERSDVRLKNVDKFLISKMSDVKESVVCVLTTALGSLRDKGF